MHQVAEAVSQISTLESGIHRGGDSPVGVGARRGASSVAGVAAQEELVIRRPLRLGRKQTGLAERGEGSHTRSSSPEGGTSSCLILHVDRENLGHLPAPAAPHGDDCILGIRHHTL